MSGLKDIVKGGWHPEKNSSSGGWRGEFKGANQVAGWMGKGKSSSNTEEAHSHQSAPLSSLKDPSSFAPPPKRTNYPAADTAGASSPTTSGGRSAVSAINTTAGVPSRAVGLGSPVTPAQRQQPVTEEQEEPPPPTGPFKADTTGLDTAGLPKPPARRGDHATLPPASSAVKPKPPSLPPRLPPRQNTGPSVPPPTYNEATSQPPVQPTANEGYLNQGALGRLGKSGIAVPGFNIGSGSSPRETQPAPVSSPTTARFQSSGQMNELQSRFSAMSSKSPSQAAPATGTSFAQKQAALKTASSFRNDPSSVSVSDMKSAASTMNNFRQRHGEQVASGLKTANGLNQKYGVVDRINNASGVDSASISQEEAHSSHPLSPTKKKPPPPPPKKKELNSQLNKPPPIPLSSKPRS